MKIKIPPSSIILGFWLKRISTIILLLIPFTWSGSTQAQELSPLLDTGTFVYSRLQLGISTTVSQDVITYALYPKAVDQQRMWDVRINVPLPAGVTFLSAEVPPTFTSNFDGREVSFFALELAPQVEIEPLIFKVSVEGLTNSLIITHAWATWKNAGFQVGVTIPAQEQLSSDSIIIAQPQLPQHLVFDLTGDVPQANYDLTSLAFQENGATLGIIFNLAGEIGKAGQLLQYTLFIDGDCNIATGEHQQQRGVEYRVNYNLEAGRATLTTWDAAIKDWRWDETTRLEAALEGKKIGLALPYHLIGLNHQFCWVAQTRPKTGDLPADWLPNEPFLALTRHEISSIAPNPIVGNLAVPLNNGQGFYDVSIFSLPAGREIARIPNARQPNFRYDGQKLLINHESVGPENLYEEEVNNYRTIFYLFKNYSATENIYEYDLTTGLETQVSDGSRDAYPFYSPQGEQLVYGNVSPAAKADTPPAFHLFVQCSLLPPHQEREGQCQNLADLSLLILDGEATPAAINYPVWTPTNRIAYQTCSGSTEAVACGIHLVSAVGTQAIEGSAVPSLLTENPTDLPADAKFNMIAFMSQRDGNWEAYLINEDGTALRNFSNSPVSHDGLPTISPNGQWVAFVSDRAGSWAVWAAPLAGGSVQKLFDLPTDTPWGNGDRSWINERISWGP